MNNASIEDIPEEELQAFADEQQQKFMCGRAAAGTLAVACGVDEEVCKVMCELDCVKTIVTVLESVQPQLVHRALVWIKEMATAPGDTAVRALCAKHLVEGGIVDAISIVLNMGDPMLGEHARDAAQALSDALKPAEH